MLYECVQPKTQTQIPLVLSFGWKQKCFCGFAGNTIIIFFGSLVGHMQCAL